MGKVKVGINGFGRIGRIAFRIGILKHFDEIEYTAINTSGSLGVAGWAHLVNYDTTYRRFAYEVKATETQKPDQATDDKPQIGTLLISERNLSVPVLTQRDPAKIPWSRFGAEVIIESTGKFTSEEEAKKHALGGTKEWLFLPRPKGGMSALL